MRVNSICSCPNLVYRDQLHPDRQVHLIRLYSTRAKMFGTFRSKADESGVAMPLIELTPATSGGSKAHNRRMRKLAQRSICQNCQTHKVRASSRRESRRKAYGGNSFAALARETAVLRVKLYHESAATVRSHSK